MDRETFKAIRLWLGMSQPQFGKFLGVSQSTVSQIEAGNRSVTDLVRSRIAKNFEPSKEFIEYLERNKKLRL